MVDPSSAATSELRVGLAESLLPLNTPDTPILELAAGRGSLVFAIAAHMPPGAPCFGQ